MANLATIIRCNRVMSGTMDVLKGLEDRNQFWKKKTRIAIAAVAAGGSHCHFVSLMEILDVGDASVVDKYVRVRVVFESGRYWTRECGRN